MTPTPEKKPEDWSLVFASMAEAEKSVVAIQSARIYLQSEPVRKLEEITRQVDATYIGTYLAPA